MTDLWGSVGVSGMVFQNRNFSAVGSEVLKQQSRTVFYMKGGSAEPC
jgi:hypothetical protein